MGRPLPLPCVCPSFPDVAHGTRQVAVPPAPHQAWLHIDSAQGRGLSHVSPWLERLGPGCPCTEGPSCLLPTPAHVLPKLGPCPLLSESVLFRPEALSTVSLPAAWAEGAHLAGLEWLRVPSHLSPAAPCAAALLGWGWVWPAHWGLHPSLSFSCSHPLHPGCPHSPRILLL